MPSIGVAMTEGTLTRWLRQAGEEVAAGDLVAEIETDKASVQVESPAAGRLGPHLHPEGAIVPVDEVLVRILEPDDDDEVVAVPGADAGPPAAAAARSAASDPRSPERSADGRRPHRLTPRARRIAREHGIPYDAIRKGGRARDVLAYIERSAAPERSAPTESFRGLIADKVSEAWRTIPHFSVTREVSAEAMVSLLERVRRSGVEASLTDFMLRALALALAGTLDEASSIGLAVATERGVVVPVIRDVLRLDAERLASERRLAIERARSGRLNGSDLSSPPSSTLSNLGAFGVDQFTGIIATGQATLLTVGRVRDRAVADARSIAIRKTFFATLNIDHRALDGADGGRILEAFASAIEDERRLGGDE